MNQSDFPWFKSIMVGLVVWVISVGVSAYFEVFNILIALGFAIIIAIIGLFGLFSRILRKNKKTLLIREKELRRLVRIILTGHSSAIIGEFSLHRALILNQLGAENQEQRVKLYGDKANRLIFSHVDVSSLATECNLVQFWEEALKPLEEKIVPETNNALSKTYKACQDNHFANRNLKKLTAQMKQEDWQLVLMIDRFEQLLHRPSLNRAEFFGGLRGLASSYSSSPLILIIAGNISLKKFHQETEYFNPGSPYFNFMESGEITLGALSDSDIDKSLLMDGYRFKKAEKHFIKDKTGGHPHLLQVAVDTLLETPENKVKNFIKSAEATFYNRVKDFLNNTLHSWSPNTCKAFISVVRKLDVSGFKSDLDELERQGFIAQNKNGEWQIRAKVFLDFVAEKTEQELCEKLEKQEQSTGN